MFRSSLFLRAHYYFILVRFFGDVPLVTEPQDVNGDLYPARAPKTEIYKLIISDLEKGNSIFAYQTAIWR